MNNEKEIEVLNDLITKSYDAEKGYKEAIENIKSDQLKGIFNEYATQRYEFGHNLKDEISKLGGTVNKGASVASKIHRSWIDLKSAVANNTDAAVLEEVVRGESYAIDAYKEALENLTIGTSAYDTVVNQRNSIRTAKERMERLELVSNITS